MKKIIVAIILCSISVISFAQTSSLENELSKNRVRLPNGWHLSPAGRSLQLGDLPLNIAVSTSKRYMAVTNNGQSIQSIQLIDPRTEKVLHNVIIPKSWYGLKFSRDEKFLYASGGNDNWILQYAIVNNKLQLKDSIILGKKWPEKISPAGIEIDDASKLLYVVTKENNSLYIVSLSGKSIIQQIELGKEAYTCLLSPDKKELYISSWGGDKVIVFNTEKRKIIGEVPVGDNPNELLLNKKGNTLFVANANDNSVSVIDIKQRKVLEVLNAALYPDAPAGSTSNGLALSGDEKKLFVANADNNCLAVFDVSVPGHSKSKGYIPVGWYPTNIKVIGKKIFVANGKGFSSFANPDGPNPVKTQRPVVRHLGDTSATVRPGYIGGLMKGTMSIIDEPSDVTLAVYSKAVYKNTPYSKQKEMNADGEAGNPIPMKVGDKSPIKHVFYIIKENRTYDQVLGDIPGGNGDTGLVLFGERITPNQHKLAKEFVLLDNFYADGEVSADGHNWSTAAHTTDYLEKDWVTSYGGRGGTYPGEGKKEIANPKKGFIWDYAKRAGVSYRTYGEFVDDGKANIPVLENHFCPYYPSYGLGDRDTVRFYAWKREFDSLVAVNAVPRLNTLRFSNDHTEGLRFGAPTPFAHVADNDLAVGLFLEHLSKSPVWKESAVFIIEDDAQNGPDHVDAHRTTAYVAGPFVKRGIVDKTMYSTSSMLRTIELILGLPPMSQYDAAATPMFKSFTSKPNFAPFESLPSNIDFNEKNKARNATAKLSGEIDLSKEDRVPDMLFSQIIWKAVKGEHSEMPAPRRSAFVKVNDDGDDEKEKGED
ncbi:bifunctional YncE family protein/alkaline phosphatase family protein [Chitinophagaceae bacterium LB-8]|uniref:Bifunctional YncE family protein/alkaline phosphatase family protein n=1 Tax=Paraflavisolibacter caeni TaxID=2982496 RepID=A0A9X2XN88_9BACT|nr:bifunctional YncE family protein/alkaline phosphatase family protein [Paraflavisolibacter caeni]MCU7548308.1 bifunctional YncE family protein/alkaline phosphatase family protein [Paraflavisolibacter caeni]